MKNMKIIVFGSIGGTLSYGIFREHKKILVFDIDNTLIHAKKVKSVNKLNMKPYPKPDFNIYDDDDDDNEGNMIFVNTSNKTDIVNYEIVGIDKCSIIPIYNVWIRPHYNIVIPLLSKFADLHIFTSASKEYADDILQNIDPQKKYFNQILYDDSWDIYQAKNLDLIAGNHTDKILIDDRNFNDYKKDNTLFYHIPSYRIHSKYDYELIKFFLQWMFVL